MGGRWASKAASRVSSRRRASPMLLQAKGITKRYGTSIVLEDAGFTVLEGEVLGLIGPNGAGKTTLFECLAGLIPTDGGEVEFRGELLPAKGRKEALFYLPDGMR